MPRYAFEQFAAVRTYTDLTWSPDGTAVAYITNVSGQYNVWRQPIAATTDGGPALAIQLTALEQEAVRRAVWSPDGSRILASADRHGTEHFQLYDIPTEHGWLYPLTENRAARHELAELPFSPDGRYITYSSNEREPADLDALVRELESGEVRPLLAGDANNYADSWSPDGRSVLVVQFQQNTDQDLYLCDVATGASRLLTAHEDEVRFSPGPWRPDGSGFYVLTNQAREFMGLAFFDVRSDTLQWVETPEWDIEQVTLSHDGRFLAWVVNQDGYSQLYVRDHTTDQVREYPELPAGVYSALRFSPTAPLLALFIARPVRPTNLYLLDVERGTVRQLTHSFLGGVPEDEMVMPTIIRYPSFDGRDIPALLFTPRDLPPGARVPVVLSIHGGPEAQEQPGYPYAGLYQYLLSRNIGVLAPNIRGSTGYGSAYQKLIYRDWGGAELRDLEHAVRYLHTLPWVDPARIGVFGGSFGGFATLSCVTRLPDLWAAAVDIVGPSNLITFVKAVPPFWRRFMQRWVGDAEEDAELLRERSPISYVDQVRAPLLIIQGANDPRVVKGESDQIVERLAALGRTVEYLVFDDEGHGFTKTANYLRAMRATAEWLERYLMPADNATSA